MSERPLLSYLHQARGAATECRSYKYPTNRRDENDSQSMVR